MKKIAVFAVMAFGVSFGAYAELVDGIVATVGTEVILQSEIMQEIAPTLQDLRKSTKDEATFNAQADEAVRQALDQAIEHKILLREAMLAGLEITDDQVEERITEIKKRFSSADEFNKELEKAGETISDFRGRVKKQIMAISMGLRKRKEFEKAAEVTEDAVNTYYQENQSKFAHSERVQVRRIFLEASADKKVRAQVKQRIGGLKKQLDDGADFAELAKANSSGPDAAQGGLLGWISRGDLVKNLEDAAFALPEGGVSDVIETDFGFTILKVEKKESAGTPALDDVRTKIEPELRAKYADEAYQKWMNELRKRSRVRIFM